LESAECTLGFGVPPKAVLPQQRRERRRDHPEALMGCGSIPPAPGSPRPPWATWAAANPRRPGPSACPWQLRPLKSHGPGTPP
jgi:hypothetical protein